MTDLILPPDDEEGPGRHEPGTFVRGSTEKNRWQQKPYQTTGRVDN